ncbi:hypothetical protein VP01_329g6 [Puccinia sorghi]|uniref:Uncharacterized protein n=1 Tax=Puccinia sorghi TaxID=27349 RepID=A0A0L6UXH6_9BASI|nr:hypothetical protein VP01_329g6 [Puccinia sorghi]
MAYVIGGQYYLANSASKLTNTLIPAYKSPTANIPINSKTPIWESDPAPEEKKKNPGSRKENSNQHRIPGVAQ